MVSMRVTKTCQSILDGSNNEMNYLAVSNDISNRYHHMHQRSQIGYENWNKFIVHTSGYGLRVTWVKALTDCIAGIAATDRISCKKINQSLDKFLNPLHQVSGVVVLLPGSSAHLQGDQHR